MDLAARDQFIDSFHDHAQQDFVRLIYDTFFALLTANFGGLFTFDGIATEQVFAVSGVFEKVNLFANAFSQFRGVVQDATADSITINAAGIFEPRLFGTVSGSKNTSWDFEIRVNGTSVIGQGSSEVGGGGNPLAPITFAPTAVSLLVADVIELYAAANANNRRLAFGDVSMIIRNS